MDSANRDFVSLIPWRRLLLLVAVACSIAYGGAYAQRGEDENEYAQFSPAELIAEFARTGPTRPTALEFEIRNRAAKTSTLTPILAEAKKHLSELPIQDVSHRRFVHKLVTLLPAPEAFSLVLNDLYPNRDDWSTLSLLCDSLKIISTNVRDSNAHDDVVNVIRDIRRRVIDAQLGYDGAHVFLEPLYEALPRLGDEGFEAIMEECDPYSELAYPALAKAPNPEGMIYLYEKAMERPGSRDSKRALEALGRRVVGNDGGAHQAFLRERAETMLSSDVGSEINLGIRLAAYTSDPELLSLLEHLVENDMHVQQYRNKDGTIEERYNIRRSAAQTVDRIRQKIDPEYAKRRGMEVAIERFERVVAAAEKELERGIDVERNPKAIDGANREIVKFRTRLSDLTNDQ